MSAEMKEVSQAITQGIAEGICYKESRSDRPPQSHPPQAPQSRNCFPAPQSPGTSIATEDSILEEEATGDLDLSEDKDLLPDKPAFADLFKPSLFKSILHKDRASIQLGSPPQETPVPSTSQDPREGLFKENAPAEVLVPKLFMNVVQCQWVQPSLLANPSGGYKNLYSVENNLDEILKLPSVDARWFP